MTPCAQCHVPQSALNGKVDDEDGCFYCDACWSAYDSSYTAAPRSSTFTATSTTLNESPLVSAASYDKNDNQLRKRKSTPKKTTYKHRNKGLMTSLFSAEALALSTAFKTPSPPKHGRQKLPFVSQIEDSPLPDSTSLNFDLDVNDQYTDTSLKKITERHNQHRAKAGLSHIEAPQSQSTVSTSHHSGDINNKLFAKRVFVISGKMPNLHKLSMLGSAL